VVHHAYSMQRQRVGVARTGGGESCSAGVTQLRTVSLKLSYATNDRSKTFIQHIVCLDVSAFKLLGVCISHDLKWTIILMQYSRKLHPDCISSNY